MSQLKVNTIRHTGASSDAVTLASDGTCTAKITNNLSNRNLIINGSMKCAQRTTSTTTNNTYSVDRFKVQSGGLDELCTNAQISLSSSDTGPWEKGFRNALQITNGNQTSGAGAADYIEIYYYMEDQDIAQSGWDYTSASSKITLSYWIKSSVAQKFYGFIYSREAWTGNGKAYSYEISNGGSNLSANTWTKITHTIPGDSGLAFDNDNTNGLGIAIIPFHGTDVTNSGNTLNTWASWVTANKTPDMTSTWYTTNDATLAITGVQLTATDYCPDYPHISYGDELARCQRYFYMHLNPSEGGPSANYTPICTAYYDNTTTAYGIINFPVTMNHYPDLYKVVGTDYFDLRTGSTSDTCDTVDLNRSSPTSATIYFTGNVSGTAGNGTMMRSHTNSAARIGFDAEL